MLVSVIVPTRNNAATIGACAASIRAQSHPETELIIVDNGSTDPTADIAERFAHKLIVAGPERSAQRNRGAEAASGSAVIFIDSDMVLDPGVVASCVEQIEAGKAGVVIPERSFGEGFWARCKALERSCYVGDDTIEAARCFTREAFEAVDGYDEAIVAGPEDWDISQRVAERFGPHGRSDAWIEHDEGRLTLRGTLSTKFYYGRSAATYVKRHRSTTRKQVARPAFLRRRDLLVREPLTAAGMLFMKVLEYVAGGSGLALSLIQERLRRA